MMSHSPSGFLAVDRKQIQNTQVLVSFALDAYRNRMMKMNASPLYLIFP